MVRTNITYIFLKTQQQRRDGVTEQPSTSTLKCLCKIDSNWSCICLTKANIYNLFNTRQLNTHTLTRSSINDTAYGTIFFETTWVKTAKILHAFSYFRFQMPLLKNTETWRIWPFGLTFWNTEIRSSVTMCALSTFLQNIRQMMPTKWEKRRTNLVNQDRVQTMKSTAFKIGSTEVLSKQQFSAQSVSLEILTNWLGERKNENNPDA